MRNRIQTSTKAIVACQQAAHHLANTRLSADCIVYGNRHFDDMNHLVT